MPGGHDPQRGLGRIGAERDLGAVQPAGDEGPGQRRGLRRVLHDHDRDQPDVGQHTDHVEVDRHGAHLPS